MKSKIKINKILLIPSPLVLNKKILLLMFFVSIQWVNSQNSQLFHILDSLKTKTYKELFKGLNDSYNDTIKERIYAKTYLHKAKNVNDTIKIANGYSQMASLTTFEVALKYSDSIINITKNSNHFRYPGYGYMLKGICQYNLGYYQLALKNYLIANDYATKNNNFEQQFHLNTVIGQLKNLWGNYEDGLYIFKSQLKLLKQGKINFQTKHNLLPNIYLRLSNSYILTNKLDSALIYVEKGIYKSLELKDSIKYYGFVSQAGIVAYHQNNFEMALDSLEKALSFEYTENDILNNHYYRGLIHQKQKKEDEAFYHFKKADSIYNLTNDVVPEVRVIQEYFVDYYKKYNDIENQLIYIDRLIYVDSIIDKNYKNLNETLVKKYDTPILLSEKEKIIANLRAKENNFLFIILGLLFFALSVILIFVRYYRKQHILKERFKKVLLNKSKKTTPKNELKTHEKGLIGISEEIVKHVLKALEKFEINNTFIDNEITLNSLSKLYNTNSNYLSKIINTYKEKNFSTYISDLRIAYCIEKLKNDTTFRKYSIKAIAFEVGFNNTESFSRAFFKKTEIHPSYFIKELEKKF